MNLILVFFCFVLRATAYWVERDDVSFQKLTIPKLTQELLESRGDERYIYNEEDVITLGNKHVKADDWPYWDNKKDVLLLFHEDYLCLYDKHASSPFSIMATINKTSNEKSSYRFQERRIDPRVKIQNQYRTPFFHPSLSTSKSNAKDTWLFSNMFDADFHGWDIFVRNILIPVIEDKGQIFLSMENLESGIKIQITLTVTAEKLVTEIQKSLLASPRFQDSPIEVFKETLDPSQMWYNYLSSIHGRRRKLRDASGEPITFLCMNDGQYKPWFSDLNYHWNRCKNADGENVDGKPDQEGLECYCDDECLIRKDCCTDYLQSCQGQTDSWEDSECESNLNTCPIEPVTLVISTDGFRLSYLEERSKFMPNYLKFRKCGTSTHMQPSFPSKTFPNHYTMATGLHPTQHGIVDNDWFDWKRNASCSVFSDRSDEDYPCAPMKDEGWYRGDPIWNALERHEKIAACILWPGTEIEINGQLPSHYWKYANNGHGPFGERIYQIFKWLQLPKWDGLDPDTKSQSRPSFINLYMDEPDHTGHAFTPYDTSGELDRAIKRVDIAIGMLMDGLKMYNLHHCVNIVLTADHGMEAGLCEDQVPVLPPTADLMDKIYVQSKTTATAIGATKNTGDNGMQWGSAFDIREVLERYQCKRNEMSLRAFDKYYLPKRLHYSATTQVESVHLLMDLSHKATTEEGCNDEGYLATHGWDNKHAEMHVPLTFYGPDFIHGVEQEKIGTVQNIELYKLILNLMKISPTSNDLMPDVMAQQFSEWGKLAPVLKNPYNQPKSDATSYKRPWVDEATNHFGVSDDLIVDLRLKAPVFMTRRHLATYDFGSIETPFWWKLLIKTLDEIAVDNSDDEFNYQFGVVYDITGEGIYVNPDDWVNGRSDLGGRPGCGSLEKWCSVNGQPIPSHFYGIIRYQESKVISFLLPWRNNQQSRASCRIGNENECRRVHPSDFNCEMTDLTELWWIEKLEFYSAKVVEIERLTNLKFFQHKSISPAKSVLLRTYINEFGEFESLKQEPREIADGSSMAIRISIIMFCLTIFFH